ncbi:MAG TPA: hypothetical protein VFJ53_05875 [Solirubrobacterales bacterium]|nr:hypothetical protein [Solirubrobacterales bacterium]
MPRISKLLSFSNVVACLALFIALGGTVYAAGKINGKQIKKSSLPGNRIKPKSVPANRIKPSSLTGQQVKAGSLTGAQIKPNSLTGDQIDEETLKVSAASLANVQYESTTLELSWKTSPATANCPSGMYAIGGGATLSDEDAAFVNSSGPSPLRTGWTATGYSWQESGPTMTVTAICIAIEKPGSSVTSSGAAPKPPLYVPAG